MQNNNAPIRIGGGNANRNYGGGGGGARVNETGVFKNKGNGGPQAG